MTDPPIVSRPASPEYRASWERIFGGAPDEPEPPEPGNERIARIWGGTIRLCKEHEKPGGFIKCPHCGHIFPPESP